MKKLKFKGFRLALAGLLLLGSIVSSVPKATAATLTPTAQVSFTFDDALASTYTKAAPTLAKYGQTGTVYVTTGCVGSVGTCPADPQSTYMTWDQVSALKTTYNWEIGAHTVSHPQLATDGLTTAQIVSELSDSKNDLTAHGFNAQAFASPYGDYNPTGNPVLAEIAKLYSSHRGFADTGYNSFPNNDYLLRDQQVQAGVTVATVKGYIDQAIASKTWLVLTFHDIQDTPNTDPEEYEYATADLDAIAAYVKSKNLRVVNVSDGLATSATNMLTNSSFDNGLADGWTTDNATSVKLNTANNGSYPSPKNSIELNSSTTNVHLFSPTVDVDSAQTYVVKSFLNVLKHASGEVAYYVDEYDLNGVWLQTQYKKSEPTAFVETINFEYKPTSATVKKARVQVVVTANSGIQAFVDNFQMFSESSTTPPVAQTPGDVNGDKIVNALDLSILLTNWSKSATRAQGDLSGDGVANALDLSILLTNWSK